MAIKTFKYFDAGVSFKDQAGDNGTTNGDVWRNGTKLKTFIESAVREIVTNSQTQTLTNKTIDAASNTISNLNTTHLGAGILDTDLTTVSASDDTIPSAKATKAYVDSRIASKDDASEILFNNTTSGLVATQVQAAIDEVEARVDLADTHRAASSGVHGISGSVVGTTDTQTLTNKSLSDSTTAISDATDPTKQIKFDAAGSVSTSTTIQGIQTANRVVTLPDATTTLVGQDTSETLTNKKLSDATTEIVDSTDANKKIKFDAAGTTLTSTTIASSQTVNRVITLPDATDTLVGKATTDTLTNKTLTSPVINTPTGIAKGDVGLGNVDNTSDATKNSAAVTLTNKIITGADIRTPVRLDMKQDTYANLVTYSATAADGQLCFATDTKATYVVKNSALSSVGGGSGSGINYILSPDADSGATGWATYADAAAASPVDGTGGSPASTFATSTTSPLRGTSSFLWTKSAANRQGEGFSYAFTIDASDKAKVLQCSFEYQIASGTFADNDLSVWIYDVTNAVLIQPAPYLIKNSGIIEKFAVEFQTASNSTSYRLIVHTASVSASAYTVKFDNFNLGPQAKLYGSAITDPVAYTATLTNLGNATQALTYSKRGNTLVINGRITIGSSLPTGTITIDLPSGLTTSATGFVGTASASTGSPFFPIGTVNVIDSNSLGILTVGANAQWNATNPTTWSAAQYFDLVNVEVPIVGWSSSQIMSSDASTAVVAARASNSGSGSITGGVVTIIPYSVVDFDDVGGMNGSGTYTVKVPGKYRVTGLVTYASAALATGEVFRLEVYKNAAITAGNRTVIAVGYTGTTGVTVADTVSCVAGDTITIRADNGSTRSLAAGSELGYFTVERISGPAQIAASESVSFSANTSTTAATTAAPFIYTVKDHDTHNAYSTSTGKFTTPMSGKYHFDSTAYSVATFTTGIYKNGTIVLYGTLGSSSANSVVSHTLNLLAGDTIEIRPGNNATASGGSTVNTFSGYRVGN